MPLKNEQVLEALRESAGVITAAAAKLGVTRQAISKRINQSQPLREARDNIIEENIDHAESQLQKAIRAGNLTAIIFYLKTFGKRRGYVERGEFKELIPPDEIARQIHESIREMDRLTVGDPPSRL